MGQGDNPGNREAWSVEGRDLVRAASGGMLVGVPLLYTTEVWSIGGATHPTGVIAVLVVTFLVVLLLNRTSGFRSTRDVDLREAAMDTVDALAVSVICVALILVLFREITWATPLAQALGKVVYQAAPFAVGMSLARHFLTESDDLPEEAAQDSTQDSTQPGALDATLADVGATITGAAFIAFAIAPTDEVVMLTSAMSPRWLLAMMAVSLVVSYAIVFEAGFTGQQLRRTQRGYLQSPLSETVVSYLMALATAAAMLWFFQRVGRGEPGGATLSRVVVLGLPAAVGGAAGRLAI